MTIYQSGTTIRLKAVFYTWAGVAADTTAAPSIKIYDSTGTQFGATITATKETTGTYYTDYTTSTVGDYVYEFSASSDGKVNLARGSFSVRFLQ